MSCGPDCVCDLPAVYVSAVSARGRAGYGINWGKDDIRNEGGRPDTYEGCVCPNAAFLTAILKVLKNAEERNEPKVLINVASCQLARALNEQPIDLTRFCRKDLISKISECRVQAVYEGHCSHDCKGFRLAIFEARRITGTHSLAPFPINDNLFKNGVIGVAIYGDYKMTASGEMKGAYARFFEEGFVDQFNRPMNKSDWFPDAKKIHDVYFECLFDTLELLLHEQYRQIRIKTSFKLVANWFKVLNTFPDDFDYSACPWIDLLNEYYKRFRNVEIEFDLEDGRQSVLEAKRMVDQLFESTVDGTYWKGGVPVVYTDGSVRGQGTDRAVAGGGVFWGPNDPRNRMCQIIGPQTSSSGEFGAVVKALETAIDKNIPRLVIRTDSQPVIDSVTVHLALWKENGWLKSNGELVKDREFLKTIDKLMGKMESVEFEKVLAHSGHEGNDGADALAGKAARDAYKEVNFSP